MREIGFLFGNAPRRNSSLTVADDFCENVEANKAVKVVRSKKRDWGIGRDVMQKSIIRGCNACRFCTDNGKYFRRCEKWLLGGYRIPCEEAKGIGDLFYKGGIFIKVEGREAKS